MDFENWIGDLLNEKFDGKSVFYEEEEQFFCPKELLLFSSHSFLNSTSSFLGNPDLKPETLEELEFGLEGSFLDNRVSVDFSIYQRTTNNLVVDSTRSRRGVCLAMCCLFTTAVFNVISGDMIVLIDLVFSSYWIYFTRSWADEFD